MKSKQLRLIAVALWISAITMILLGLIKPEFWFIKYAGLADALVALFCSYLASKQSE